MHPNELQQEPEGIEFAQSVDTTFHGRPVEFLLFRYRMAAGHWSGSGWQMGLCGPFRIDDQPYKSAAGGFARAGDTFDEVAPEELVKWYVGILESKFPKGSGERDKG